MGPDIQSLGWTELFFRFAVWDKLKKKTFFIQFQNYKSYFSYFLPSLVSYFLSLFCRSTPCTIEWLCPRNLHVNPIHRGQTANFCCLKYLYLNIVAVSDSCQYFEQKLRVMRAHDHSKNLFFFMIAPCQFNIWLLILYFFLQLFFFRHSLKVRSPTVQIIATEPYMWPHPLSHWFTGQKKETKNCAWNMT